MFFEQNWKNSTIWDFRKDDLVLYGNKLDERIHLDKSSKYEIKGKLTTILGS